ncbi:MAG: M16 family metallopeptidase [Syntrophales bacterium]
MRYRTVGILMRIIASAFLIIIMPSLAFSYDMGNRVLSYELKNGLKILMVERHLSPTVSFYIRYRVGAVDEIDGRTGTAHLLEHMLFKGTKTIGTKNFNEEQEILKLIADTGKTLDLEKMKGKNANKSLVQALSARMEVLQRRHKKWFVENEIDRLYVENGGDKVNASTGHDLTTYHVSLPSNKIELWARIEADRMTQPVFREFYSERNVVMEERKQRVESEPDGQLYEQFLATAFIAHPYRRPVLGWPSDMRSLSLEYTEAFFKRYHAPNNTVIAVVGDIDPASTLTIIKKYFGPIPSRHLDPTPITEEPPQKGERRVDIVSDANPQMVIGYHKPALPDFDDYVFDLIECIFSKGRTSRFHKVLVEEMALAESVHAVNGLPGAKYDNLFAIFAKPRHPHTNAEIESAIYDEIEKLKIRPVTAKELEKVKNQIKADFIRSLNSNSGLANLLSYFEAVTGSYQYITDHIKVIERVTSEDIMRVASKYLAPDNRTVVQLVGKN